MNDRLIAAALACMLLAQTGPIGAQQQQVPAQQQGIPDAPTPQLAPGVVVTPGKGSNGTQLVDPSAPAADGQQAVGSTLSDTPLPPQTHPDDGDAPLLPAAGEGSKVFTLSTGVNFVDIPFTVKDSKNRLVPGLTWRDIRIYENNVRQQMRVFTVDPFPLSVALVIDQSMPFTEMEKVNTALGALQGAFTSYDEVAVFTYNSYPKMQTDFTAAQSTRLGAVLERSKTSGREANMGTLGGPLEQTTVINGQNVDPNTSARRNSLGMQINAPRDSHPLNDAILAAATATLKAGKGRRRIVYVISDGKEYGSKTKQKDLIKFLQQNKIAVYGTLVGDSSVPGLGFLDRIHLPLQMRDNVLPIYAGATGGQLDAEFRTNGIEKSFARITEEVRTQYTVGYYSREPFIDGKFRSVEVKVLRPNLTVIAKSGYYPTAADARAVSPAAAMKPASGATTK